MMPDGFELAIEIPATPAAVYKAWLSSEGHTAMTGSPAVVDGRVDGPFSAWDGYISGTFLELEADRRILQAWRTSEFPAGAPDSKVELLLEESGQGTRLTLRHWDIPAGQEPDYRRGWEDFYFKPMREYFG